MQVAGCRAGWDQRPDAALLRAPEDLPAAPARSFSGLYAVSRDAVSGRACPMDSASRRDRGAAAAARQPDPPPDRPRVASQDWHDRRQNRRPTADAAITRARRHLQLPAPTGTAPGTLRRSFAASRSTRRSPIAQSTSQDRHRRGGITSPCLSTAKTRCQKPF